MARVGSVAPHPDADRLRVCAVDDGSGNPVQIVCGAPNVREGLLVPLARVGGRLPDGTKLKKAKLRGVESYGMLCSAAELGLSEQRDGLMELSGAATPGVALAEFLRLDDNVITIELTPDRGDCLSVRGLARDLGARHDLPLVPRATEAVVAQHADTWPVEVEASSACVRYAGCVIRNVDLSAGSPIGVTERLRRSGVRAINPAVDVTNHVMLELGQPMHAFDLDKLQGAIRVRLAIEGESLTLLDGRKVALRADTTVIADDRGAIGIAGIMGGQSTAVDENTRNVFLESALFLPEQIAGKPRRYASQSESSHRFERGVDPDLQVEAMAAALSLLTRDAGGEVGPIVDWQDEASLPYGDTLVLRRERIRRLLGVLPEDALVERILRRLGVGLGATDDGWHVTPPSYRYDLRIEEDYIEEIVRVYGLDRLPRTSPTHRPIFRVASETDVPVSDIRRLLVNRGYQEVVTLSFVDGVRQALLRADLPALALENPISSDLSVMRTSLLTGLVDTLRRNLNRQRNDLRLFETGLRFVPGQGGQLPTDAAIDVSIGDDIQLAPDLRQQSMIAGLISGSALPETWSATARSVDFFDIKADVEALFARVKGARSSLQNDSLDDKGIDFGPCRLDHLHPGQRASILREGVAVGYVGALNPALHKALDLAQPVLVFELALSALRQARVPFFQGLSRFPSVRRDIALVVDASVSHEQLVNCVRQQAPDFLVDIITFDVYSGERLEKGKKSIALGLILQHASRTLEDTEVDSAIDAMVAASTELLGAVLRV